jgi:hypothetical protein
MLHRCYKAPTEVEDHNASNDCSTAVHPRPGHNQDSLVCFSEGRHPFKGTTEEHVCDNVKTITMIIILSLPCADFDTLHADFTQVPILSLRTKNKHCIIMAPPPRGQVHIVHIAKQHTRHR